jgi:hypothetical protein
MPDAPGPPQHPSPFSRKGPSAIISVQVNGPRDALVTIAVEHRDRGDEEWSRAGSFPMLAPAESSLRVSGLKEEVRLRFDVASAAKGAPVAVRVLPPEWLPC